MLSEETKNKIKAEELFRQEVRADLQVKSDAIEERKNLPLGLIEIPESTFKNDLEITDRYQSFSAELLRLSLLGITAIGALVTTILLKETPEGLSKSLLSIINLSNLKFYLTLSLLFLGISAICALSHRYFSTDSMACHLEFMRYVRRGSEDDSNKAEDERIKRNRRFSWSFWLFVVSGTSLWIGTMCLALSFILGVLYP
jgi:hypothetical protein